MIQEDLIESISKYVSVSENEKIDPVQKIIDVQTVDNSKKICLNCHCVIDKHSEKCLACGYTSKNYPSREILYGDIAEHHPKELPNIKIGEIIDVNPNSCQTIKLVSENLCKQGGVGSIRKWIRIGFDGFLYRIASNLRKEILVCSICKSQIDTKVSSFESHVKENQTLIENPTSDLFFGNVLLVVGAGHMEKNLLLAVFRLCRKLFIEKLAYRLGFHSKKAIEYIVNCGNHSWQISSIAYEAFSRELVFVYLLECLGKKAKPTPNHFTEWQKNEVKNANYHLY